MEHAKSNTLNDKELDQRYSSSHFYGKIEFVLIDYYPDIEEAKFLMLKVLEQAIRDYISLEKVNIPNSNMLWEQARDFLFEDDYCISWGEMVITLTDLLDILDMDIEWVRMKTKKKYREKNG